LYYTAHAALSLGYSLIERVLIAARALWFYTGKLFWPTELAGVYPLWDIHAGDPLAWVCLIAAVALAAALWLGRHRLGRGPLAGALFFAVTLSPMLGFLDYAFMKISFVADRFQYLAAGGVMAVTAAAAHGVGRLPGPWKTSARTLVAVVLVLLGTLTWRQAGIYQNEITFFSHVVSLNPRQAYAHRRRTIQLSQAGRLEEGLAAGRFAVGQLPDSAHAHGALGFALLELRRFDEAETTLRRALEINPRDAFFLNAMGEALQQLGRTDEAVEHYERTLRFHRRNTHALTRLAFLHFGQKRYEEALRLYRTVVEIDPSKARAHSNVGAALYNLNRYDEALRSYEHALSLDPDLLYARTGARHARKALQAGGG